MVHNGALSVTHRATHSSNAQSGQKKDIGDEYVYPLLAQTLLAEL